MRHILIIFAFCSLLFAQPTITTEYLVDGSFDGASGIYATDMDGDGDIDILGAGRDAGDISWWENDGTPNNNTWTEYAVDASFIQASSVYATDMDGDGDVDIIGSAYGARDIAWWINDGNPKQASWTKYTVDAEFEGAYSAYAIDMDGDGDVDILGTSYGASDVSWWENDGTPNNDNWTEHQVDAQFNGAYCVRPKDMDNDGDIDLVAAAYNTDDISWFENDGTPNNNNWTEYLVDGDFDGASSVNAADMDNDGDVDIVGAAKDGNDISWWENDGDPKQNNWTEYLVDGDFDGARSVYVTDMDGDGDVDILAAAFESNDVSWFENDGTPNNNTWTEHVIDASFSGPRQVYATDMDGDGDMDVLGAAASGDDISWWENTSITPSLPTITTEYSVDGSFNGSISVYATDMDGDGDVDILGAAKDGNDISWWENDGTPNNSSWTEYLVDGDFGGVRSVYATDMDGDGDVDILGAGENNNDISWWENDGDPKQNNWTEYTIDASFNGAFSVYATDMDGDGDIDVLGAAKAGDDISWWENDGTPNNTNWTEYKVENSFNGARSVYATDMDGDGDVDVLGAAADADDIAWWINDGDPKQNSWTKYKIDNNFDGAYSVYATDMDGDGDIDVLGAAQAGDDISWWENDGTPNNEDWTEYTVDGSFNEARSVYAADMDGDGDVDILGAATTDDDISWWENDGTPNNSDWTEHSIDASFDGANSVYATDMDGDGDMDVVGAAKDDDDISWWENKVTLVSGNAGFRMLSSPVAGTIYDELLAPFWIQGMTNGDTESGTANVWTYNAGTSAWASLSNLTTDSYTAGTGILIYIFVDVDGDSDDDISSGVNVGIVNGTENSATVSVSTTASTWNLLGNPFVSTIDADQLFSDNSNYTSTVYVYDDANSQYNTWNGITGDLSNGLIAPYQGFWIQSVSGGTTFQFTSSCKSSSIGTFYKTMNDSSGSVAFQLSSGSYNSTAYLSFNIDALEGIDNADAYKLLPLGAGDHLTSMFYVGEVALNISNLPYDVTNPIAADMDVMLLTAANDSFYTSTGTVSMSWDIGNLPTDMTIYLVDQLTLDTLDLQAEDSYSFDLQEKGGFSATGNTNQALYPRQGQNRFQVLINSTTVSVDEELLPIQYALHPAYPNPFNPTTTLRYDLPEQAQVTLTIYDLMGRKVTHLVNTTQEAGYRSVQWNATDSFGIPVSTGVYLYQIRAGEFVQTRKMVLLK